LRKSYIFLVLVILAVISGWYLGSLTKNNQNTFGNRGGISVDLIVKQYRNGTLISEQYKRGDPFTKNFVLNMYGLLDGWGSSVTMQDETNTARSIGYGSLFSGTAYVGIGTGTNAFDINNYNLISPIAWVQSSATSTSSIGTNGNISFSASFPLSSAATITEVGVKVSEGGYNFLILRDLITPINANAGDTITVQYIIRLNG